MFLYFIENREKVQKDDLESLGLGYLRFEKVHARPCTAGPSGQKGCILTHGDMKRLGYYPEEQEWVNAEGQWIGWWKDEDESPCEATLARPKIRRARGVELGNGETWYVADYAEIPKRFGYNEAGEKVLLPMEKYRAVKAAYDGLWGIVDGGLPYSEMVEYVGEVLGFNYYLGARELVAVGLLDQENLMEVAKQAIDYYGKLEALRGKGSAA